VAQNNKKKSTVGSSQTTRACQAEEATTKGGRELARPCQLGTGWPCHLARSCWVLNSGAVFLAA